MSSSLTSGTQLGPYSILAQIGAGGMGEVYSAKDTRLDRTVAIKVLSSQLSSNIDVKQRFEREARTISSLSHPNICALYDIGQQDGISYLVMELLEGETLAERLSKGALPLEQVLRYGMQIADALDKAHRQGIIHRDLKPGNVMLTKSGIKLLDFGLAKLQPSVAQSLSGVSILPTEQRDITREGTILGTMQYMAPEQLEGSEIDARTDIFAFGSVLYEMATGKKAFTGKSQASLISAILSVDPPPISTVQSMAPPALDRVVKTCLAKDPEDRWQTARDALLELRWISEGQSQSGVAAPAISAPRKKSALLPWLTTALLFAGTAFFGYHYFHSTTVPQPVTRFTVSPPEGTSLAGTIAVSPDERQLAFVASGNDGVSFLWVRSFDSIVDTKLQETQDARYPFWSPDGRYIAFFADGKLKKIEVSTRNLETIGDVPDPRGGSWSKDGLILFAPNANDVLYSVPAAGGDVTQVTKLETSLADSSHRWPQFLPDGRHFLFYVISGQLKKTGVYLGSLDSNAVKFLLPSDSPAAFVPEGYLLFLRQGKFMYQKFDVKGLKLEELPVSFPGQVWTSSTSTALSAFSASENVLAYRTGSDTSQLHWYDRTGKDQFAISTPGQQAEPFFSPDEKRVVLNRNNDLWILELASGAYSRFTFDPSADSTAIWSPDGRTIVFTSSRNGAFNLHKKPSDGSTEEELLLPSTTANWSDDWSKDGRFIIYENVDPKTRFDLWILPVDGDRKPVPYLRTQSNEAHATFSPNGRWVAYISDESGRGEVYVRSFPGEKGGKWQISTRGGDQPVWRRDGGELFFIAPDRKLMSVNVDTDSTEFKAGVPIPLFQTSISSTGLTGSRNHYLVSASGNKFLINNILQDSASSPITVVLNWTADLKH